MLATSATCPKCRSALNPTKLAAGQKIVCPKCGASITVTGGRSKGLQRSIPIPQDNTKDDVSFARAKTRPDINVSNRTPDGERRMSKVATVLIILAVLFFFVGVSVGGFYGISALKSKHPKEQVAAAKTPTEQPSAESVKTPALASERPAPPEDNTLRALPLDSKPKAVLPSSPRKEERAKIDNDFTPVGASSGTSAPPLVTLPKEEQERVDKAIDKGVGHLKSVQLGSGIWPGENGKKHHEVGYTALPALTLLECGESPKSEAIEKAAALVRQRAPSLCGTYELSLSVLFLDRLGNPDDEKLIRMMALRLISGQRASGGWTYECRQPQLNDGELDKLLAALQVLTPTRADLLATTSTDKASGVDPRNPSQQSTDKPGSKPSNDATMSQRAPIDLLPEKILNMQRPIDGKTANTKLADIPDKIKNLPVLQEPDKLKAQAKGEPHTTTDNSNTQFAILALLAAKRHGIPMDRTLALMVMRFQTSQNKDGSWGYHYKPNGGEPERPAMTGVGLLGLAVGHGLVHEIYGGAGDAGDRQPMDDKMIKDGFQAFAKHIKEVNGTTAKRDDRPMHNLYFLWTVERVAVLYKKEKIGNKDWYRWGAKFLCDSQDQSGYWQDGKYWEASKTIDTCFALLFLKRVNLAKDLTEKLPLFHIDP